MDNTIPKIESSTKLVQEIYASSIEQSSGISQVNEAVQQFNEISQQNAASSEQLTSSAETLMEQAEHLKKIMSFFR